MLIRMGLNEVGSVGEIRGLGDSQRPSIKIRVKSVIMRNVAVMLSSFFCATQGKIEELNALYGRTRRIPEKCSSRED